jgi:VanZ family protein
MMTDLRDILIRYSTILLVLAVLLIVYGTLLPSDMIVKSKYFSFDKVIHAIGFGGLTALIWLHLKRKGMSGRSLDFQALAWGIAAGALIEILQYVLPINRSAEWADFLADIIGSLIAVGLLRLLGFDRSRSDK